MRGVDDYDAIPIRMPNMGFPNDEIGRDMNFRNDQIGVAPNLDIDGEQIDPPCDDQGYFDEEIYRQDAPCQVNPWQVKKNEGIFDKIGIFMNKAGKVIAEVNEKYKAKLEQKKKDEIVGLDKQDDGIVSDKKDDVIVLDKSGASSISATEEDDLMDLKKKVNFKKYEEEFSEVKGNIEKELKRESESDEDEPIKDKIKVHENLSNTDEATINKIVSELDKMEETVRSDVLFLKSLVKKCDFYKGLCIYCQTNEINAILNPCGHVGCKACLSKMDANKTCYNCFTVDVKVQQMFLS